MKTGLESVDEMHVGAITLTMVWLVGKSMAKVWLCSRKVPLIDNI